MAGLNVPNRGKRSSHARSVTNFCKEANIEESDQIDLAEFIVAARYLGSAANDDQLMDVFMDMEDTDAAGPKDPKALIKELMAKVDEEYGLADDIKANDPDNADQHEIVAINPLDAFAEDAIWQSNQIDDFLNQTQQDQNLRIARNLLATTALTRHEIAEITGVDADLLEDYDSDYSTDEEDEEDDEDEEPTASATATATETTKQSQPKAKGVSLAVPADGDKKKADVSEGVTIRATDFSKSVMLTKDDLGTLQELIEGGKDKIATKSEDALKLLKKLNGAININPKGHSKRTKTLARLKLDKVPDEKEKDKELKLPAKYRVVIHPGALCKTGNELTSKEVCKLPIGSVVTVEEIEGRRCRISAPNEGWLSLHASDGRTILQRGNVKSAAMDKAIHAERARQTKVLILKSITTLNDATVTRILEKSDWNLRRAIEAFYIAKYKTQEYLTKKEQSAKKDGKDTKKDKPGAAAPKDKGKGKKGKMAWWKSWKTFANDNQ
eukprot:534946_1